MTNYYNDYGKLRDRSNDMYIVTRMDGKILDINKSANSKLGLGTDVMLDELSIQDYFLNREDWENYTQRIEKNGYVSGLDITLSAKDNTQITGIITSAIIETHGSEILAFIIHDITHYIESELDAMRLNLEIMKVNDQLKQAHSTLSHLAYIGSNIKSLKKYIDKILSYEFKVSEEDSSEFAFLKEDLDSIFNETFEGLSRIENITKSLKRFSRMGDEEHSDSFNLNNALKDTINIAKSQCPSHVEIQLDLSEIPEIHCFANDINQVLLNMVINALQAMKEPIPGKEHYLKISTCALKNIVQVRIEDNGTGVPKEIESRIYDPFFTTKEVGQGTGLGLGICFNIINQKHNGALWLENNGDPTVFIINLPLKEMNNAY